MSRSILLLALLLCACTKPERIGNESDDALFNAGEIEQALAPGVTPVRIGEGGPRFAACGGAGEVWNLSPGGEASLTVRASPFAEATAVTQLANGRRVFVCARSMDQRWLGVVIPPADTPPDTPDADCGTAAPAASPRPYPGPCASGWVASAFVRLSAR